MSDALLIGRNAVVGGIACLLSQGVAAGGFYIPEIGTPVSLGTAGAANVTNTVGPDAAWTNPAGMTGLETDQLMSGFQGVIVNAQFDSSVAEAGGDDGGNAGNNAVIPSVFYVNKFNDRFRFGFSVTAPLGGADSITAITSWDAMAPPRQCWRGLPSRHRLAMR